MDKIQENSHNNVRYHHGAYGVVVRENRILLVCKQKGPYTGLYDLVGGKIEAGETALQALIREFQEEVSMLPEGIFFLKELHYTTQYQGRPFEHTGQIFKIESVTFLPGHLCEEEYDWFPLDTLDRSTLTPFAREALIIINN